MAQNNNTGDDAMLDDFFAAARADAPVPSAALLGRIMSDADEVAAGREVAPAKIGGKTGLFAALAAVIGGWPALAGMATATVAGVWIGVAQPQGLSSVAGALLPASTEYTLDDLSPSFDALAGFDEGWSQ